MESFHDTTRIRIAVIGAGLIGPRHIQAILASEHAKLVAIVDPATTGRTLADQFGVHHYSSVQELLSSPNERPEGAIICTPNHTHVSVAKELSSAGIHLLIEKPVSTDQASGRELVNHIAGTTVKAIVGHHRRFNSYMLAAKKIVSSGRLGKIVAINGLWTLYKPLDYFNHPSEWRKSVAGGAILINMVHEVDLLHYLFGPIVRVHAEKIMSQRGFDAEEGAAMTLRFESGVVGTFLISDTTPSPHNFESGTGENPLIPWSGKDFYRIFGTEAMLSVPDMSIWSHTGTKSWHSELLQDVEEVASVVPFQEQLNHFCKVIRNKETPGCTIQAGLSALIVCQAIKEALESNCTVDIDALTF